jgi:hypothetical protein
VIVCFVDTGGIVDHLYLEVICFFVLILIELMTVFV